MHFFMNVERRKKLYFDKRKVMCVRCDNQDRQSVVDKYL